MSLRPGVLLALSLVVCAGMGCHPNKSAVESRAAGAGPYRVVCTTGMVADLVRNIAGKHAVVDQLMKAGVDPHLYKASPGDISQLQGADVIFFSGQHLEGKMADLLSQIGKSRRCVAVTENVPVTRLIKSEEGAVDPHLWFDVALWQLAALRIRDELCQYDPSHADEYQRNYSAFDAELVKLHAYVREQLASIEKSRRVLVTAHDAFHYFGQAYDLEVRSIQGISTESEASLKQVNDLVRFMVTRKIKAVFVESSVSEKNIKALIEGCADQKHPVVIGGELYSDAPGADGTPEATYIGMVKHNVDTIVKALR